MKRFTAFLAAALAGFLLRQLSVPIPYMLGGIAVGFLLRTFLDNTFFWPRSWRGLMLGVAGYGIGSNCTPDTFFKLSQETLGILGAQPVHPGRLGGRGRLHAPAHLCQPAQFHHGLPAGRAHGHDRPDG